VGDKDEQKRVQKLLKVKIREGKESYKSKMEQKLQQKNTREVWKDLNMMSGHENKVRRYTSSSDQTWVDELNVFFNRFNVGSNDSKHSLLSSLPRSSSTSPALSSSFSPIREYVPGFSLSVEQVRSGLKRIKINKSPGPDGINSRVLKACADQICWVVHYIFNLSLHLEKIPVLWKTSCVVPVPKLSNPTEFSHYRPIALTAQLMKVFERLVLNHIKSLLCGAEDRLQFAYKTGVGVDDALIYLLHKSLSHLENPDCTVRITFFDFSSAFNTI